MLSPDDATLVHRAAIPGLALVLDPEAVADRVASVLPALGVTGATATYVRYKPATSCVVGYRLAVPGGQLHGYVRTSVAPGDEKLVKVVDGTRRHSRGEVAAALLGPGAVVVLAPHDHDLPVLRRLADRDEGGALLRRLLGPAATEGGWWLEPLRHNPERRWVARLHGADRVTRSLKVHRPVDHHRAVAGARAFATVAGDVPAASLLASSRRHGVAVHEWVEGSTAAAVLSGPDVTEADVTATGRAVGRLLAAVHAHELPRGALAPVPDEQRAARAAATAVGHLDPGLAAPARRLAARLADIDGGASSSLLHGDCSMDQVVCAGSGLTLIDLDRAARGDAHVDLAQVIADLAVQHLAGRLHGVDGEAPVVEALLDGYLGAGGSVDARRLDALVAARLVRLAPEPFRRREVHWVDRMAAILDRAARGAGTGART